MCLSFAACHGKIHSPDKIAAEMLPALTDFEAINRAVTCNELTKELTEFRAGYPYDVVPEGSLCKGISKSKPDQRLHGGFMLPSYANCAELPQELAMDIKRHEGNLNAKIGLACGADGKVTLEPNVSVQLAARMNLRERLAATVKAANAGTVSAEIAACYFGVKQEMMKSASAIRSARCQALTDAINTKNVTYDAIWSHAHVSKDFDEYRKAHSEAWEEAIKSKKQTVFFDKFTYEAQSNACSTTDTQDVNFLKLASHTAAETCM